MGNYRLLSVGVKSNNIQGANNDENNNLFITDFEALKRRYRIGLETLVVYALTDGY